MIKPLDRVSFAEKQLHGNLSILMDGQVLSIEASSARIMVDGEIESRTIPLSSLRLEEDAYGEGYAGGFNELPVVNAMRNQ